jgi:Flp pilus assembly protein TadG
MIVSIRNKFAIAARRLLRGKIVRRLARDEKGIATVEFAIVAAPFLALMFAIMETAIVFFAGQTLETAVADSARLIMTGQAQTSSFTAAQFKSAVCAKILGLFDCQNGLQIDVKTYS